MRNGGAIQALVRLGFTALEAEAYTWLLGERGATAYRIAKGIGKPVANTYKAIESLQKKGAVLVDEDESRVCRAVPAQELLQQLDRGFASSRSDAARALSRVAEAEGDDRVYTLRTAAQVLERARAMLRGAREVVLIDAFPGALAALRPELARAVGRGVDIAIKTYRPMDAGGAETFVEPEGEDVLARWSGEWLNIVVDGAEHLLAFLDGGLTRVRQAIWTGSPYLSWVYHSALAAELVMAGVQSLSRRNGGKDRLRALMARFDALTMPDATGYRALMERFGRPQPEKSRRKKEKGR